MWVHKEKFDQAGFEKYLRDNDALLLDVKGDYELIRYTLGKEPIMIWDRPRKGRITFCKKSGIHYNKFLDGKPIEVPQLRRRPIYTIYTDAGIYTNIKMGSWAGILVDPNGAEIEFSNTIKCSVNSSTAAEAMAVANCLHEILRRDLMPDRSKLIVVCDNKTVVNYLRKSLDHYKKSKSALVKEAFKHIKLLCKKHNITIKSRWVKSHQPIASATVDGQYNNRADALCRLHSKKQKEISIKKGK